MIVFLFQLFISYFWLTDFIGDELEYQPFTVSHTSISIICAMLFQMTLYAEIQEAVQKITYLKRSRGTKSYQQGRLINILLLSMKCITPIFSIVVLLFTFTKEANMKMIIKSFVTIGFISNIDNIFVSTMPDVAI